VSAFVKTVMAGGMQTKAQAAKVPAAAAASGGAFPGLLAWPQVDFAKFGAVERKPLGRIKKISGANLHRNWVVIPHVTNHDEADITELEAFRVLMNKEHEKSGTKFTMLAFLIKACVAALKKFPEFNASLDGDELVLKKYFHIGFAADTPNGLMVPVIKDADQKGVAQIAKEMSELAAKARDGKLSPAEMSGGCFSISSLGGIGGVYFTPIINAPEVAILGVCKSFMKPVWNGKTFEPRLTLPLSLSWDHRVIDGASRRALQRLSGRHPGGLPPRAAVRGSAWQAIELRVPDIGDFKDVAVIEILVKPGDTVAQDQSLITVESDKASMEIPATAAGLITGAQAQAGDKLNQGDLIAIAEGARRLRRPWLRLQLRLCRLRLRLPASPVAATHRHRDLHRRRRPRLRRAGARRRPRRLLGRLPRGGPWPQGRAGRALRDARRRLPERRLHPVQGAAACGGGDGRGRPPGRSGRRLRRPQARHRPLRGHKEKVIGKLTGGLAQMAKMRKVTVVRGYGSFVDPQPCPG
jgi:pyruvate/2-oxoglutarate dehydrogenase complex dihydrolipoamide acyltransferase (E2) component